MGGSVVFSEGVGSLRFNPVVNGQEIATLEFTNVLYVPALCSNLFSVLYLTLHRHFTVCIEQDTMHFHQGQQNSLPSEDWSPKLCFPDWGNYSCGGICLPFICHHSPFGLGPLASSSLPPPLGRHQEAAIRPPGDGF